MGGKEKKKYLAITEDLHKSFLLISNVGSFGYNTPLFH